MPDWMNEEKEKAEQLSRAGETANPKAPKLVKIKNKPETVQRSQKSFFMQERHAMGFDRVVFEQKMAKGKKSTELIEEAIELLLKKYKIEF